MLTHVFVVAHHIGSILLTTLGEKIVPPGKDHHGDVEEVRRAPHKTIGGVGPDFHHTPPCHQIVDTVWRLE